MRKLSGKGISKKTFTILVILAGIVFLGFLFYSFTRNPRFFEGYEVTIDLNADYKPIIKLFDDDGEPLQVQIPDWTCDRMSSELFNGLPLKEFRSSNGDISCMYSTKGNKIRSACNQNIKKWDSERQGQTAYNECIKNADPNADYLPIQNLFDDKGDKLGLRLYTGQTCDDLSKEYGLELVPVTLRNQTGCGSVLEEKSERGACNKNIPQWNKDGKGQTAYNECIKNA